MDFKRFSILIILIVVIIIGATFTGKTTEDTVQCIQLSDTEVSCTISLQTPFELFNESYQDIQKCEEMGVPPVAGGCFLNNVSYDKQYVNKLESKRVGDCWATATHKFVGIKKGYTEIITTGTCEYNKIYKIEIL